MTCGCLVPFALGCLCPSVGQTPSEAGWVESGTLSSGELLLPATAKLLPAAGQVPTAAWLGCTPSPSPRPSPGPAGCWRCIRGDVDALAAGRWELSAALTPRAIGEARRAQRPGQAGGSRQAALGRAETAGAARHHPAARSSSGLSEGRSLGSGQGRAGSISPGKR